MKLLVGLGNPGARYESTRHNVGFMVVDRLAAQSGIAIERHFCGALVGEGTIEDAGAMLAKPQTFMNHSGQAVGELLRRCGIATEDLVVINDDLDLPFGRLRIRPGGSAGGHRGLISIAEALSGAQFLRLRVGIGRPPEGSEVIDHVLDGFNPAECEQLGAVLGRATDSVRCLLREGVDRAMGIYNRA